MELRDLIVTPLLLMVIYATAYVVRPYVTDEITRRYFIPALTARVLGALAVGFIYQFYYGGDGGDTFGYHTHGSRHIWNALIESPGDGVRIFFSGGEYGPGLWDAAEKIWYWKDPSSFFVIQVLTVFDLVTFSSYTGSASLFAVIAFIGGWMLFKTFYNQYPTLHRGLALSTLFVPSVVFWGSGIYKDSLTLAALGVATYCVYRVFISHRLQLNYILLLGLALWVIYSIKFYILLCFLPCAIIWIFIKNLSIISSAMMKIMLAPFVFTIASLMGYYGVVKIAEDNPRYNIAKLAETSRITAYDIRYGWGARTGDGSGYDLGETDGSWQSTLKLSPQAINVSLFRPYLWEVKNFLMLFSAVESFFLLLLSLYVVFRVGFDVLRYIIKPDVLFCLMFALIFGFAVGVSTYNFGTLSRYKIPLMPLYCISLTLIYGFWNNERKLSQLAAAE